MSSKGLQWNRIIIGQTIRTVNAAAPGRSPRHASGRCSSPRRQLDMHRRRMSIAVRVMPTSTAFAEATLQGSSPQYS